MPETGPHKTDFFSTKDAKTVQDPKISREYRRWGYGFQHQFGIQFQFGTIRVSRRRRFSVAITVQFTGR